MKKLVITSLAAAICSASFASEVKKVGTIPTVVPENRPQVEGMAPHQPNIVMLQKVKLTDKAKQALRHRLKQIKQVKKTAFKEDNQLPPSHNLGMNNTPVLNQGAHGSCVTFANAGALDALIGQGDYVSELCSLTLGKYLASEDSEYPSGWDGSWGPIVLEQFFKYGVVSMDKQKEQGCGGLYNYPLWDPSQTGSYTSVKSYAQMSESIDQFKWTPIIEVEEVLKGNRADDPEQTLNEVKSELVAGNRVTFGVLLDVYRGSNGALGSYKTTFDTWMLTPKIEQDAENNNIEAGHEMLIIGYDDDAVVTAPDGTENKGLLILRNSWGKFAGDHGTYYMSYDHFKLLALEAQYLSSKNND